VVRVVDERAVLTKVEIGERILGRVEIRAGVSAGDSVVIAGQLKIGDGTLVSVINSDDPA
jgi:membrane fusion protein (multidrug efflux system)